MNDLRVQTILMVDDTPENIEVLNGILVEYYKIKAATNGEMALQIAQAQPTPDLILLDIMMPEMDGYEVCTRLKQNDLSKNIPVIFVTAMTEIEDETRGFEVGAVDYITKPYNPEIVRARVNTHLALVEAKNILENQNEILEKKVIIRTKELADANKKLTQLDSAKSDFLSLISHELKTPLSGIVGASDILKDSITNKNDIMVLNILKSSVTRLKRFSEIAMLITSLKAAKIEVRNESVSINEIIQIILDRISLTKYGRNIEILTSFMEPNPSINTDSKLFKIALSFVLDNAFRFIQERGKISVTTKANNVIIIKNTGSLFPESILNGELTFFKSEDIMHHTKGLKLGLPTTKMILDVLGGNITFENQKDGATVFITMPSN